MKKDEEVKKPLHPEGAPIAGASQKPVDRETLSHQYQATSPAVDTNAAVGFPAESILDKIDSKENLKKKEDAAEAAANASETIYGYADDIDPSKRDVSDPYYAQPGSDRHKAFLKKAK